MFTQTPNTGWVWTSILGFEDQLQKQCLTPYNRGVKSLISFPSQQLSMGVSIDSNSLNFLETPPFFVTSTLNCLVKSGKVLQFASLLLES
jgi:hypothetical protein